jgi:hypothetical protein
MYRLVQLKKLSHHSQSEILEEAHRKVPGRQGGRLLAIETSQQHEASWEGPPA